jgi:hypothetical protein
MSTDHNNSSKLAFTSHCLPGSLAEQQEKERLAEFQRRKAEQRAEEERNKPHIQAQREQAYLEASEANKDRRRGNNRMTNPLQNGFRSS